MTGDNFEYAIKKDIRNNPIVREVDGERHREMLRSVGLGLFLVLVALFAAWQHFDLLRHGYRIEQMQRARAEEQEIARHLRLEIESLRSPGVIEHIATTRLQMVVPGPQDFLMIERAIPADAPPQSMVARR
jgi:cell division protein FtsL